MYVDDGNIVDFKAAKGSGQSSIHTLFDCLGSPLDLAKRELMSDKCVFLGVVHDMTKFHIDRTITFWPRERLLNKLRLYLVRIRESGKCTPAEAAKLRGTAQFMAHASAGGVGKFGLAPFKQRQYYDQAPWEASFTMKLATEYMNKLLADWPSRQIAVDTKGVPPIVIATDAQADPWSQPSGGFVVVDKLQQQTFGGYLEFPEDIGYPKGIPLLILSWSSLVTPDVFLVCHVVERRVTYLG